MLMSLMIFALHAANLVLIRTLCFIIVLNTSSLQLIGVKKLRFKNQRNEMYMIF